MNYTFSFGLSSAIGYPIDFYTKLNDTYTMYFWGFELIEIARCVSKYVELSSIEKRSIISKLVVASRVFSKYKERDKVEDTRSIDKTDMKLLSNVVIPTKIVVSILIDSIYESSSASLRFDMFKSSTNALTNPLLKDVEPELVKEIYNKTSAIVAELVNTVHTKKIWESIECITDIQRDKPTASEIVLEDIISRPLSLKRVSINPMSSNIKSYKYATVGSEVGACKFKSKYTFNKVHIKRDKVKITEAINVIKKNKLKVVSPANIMQKKRLKNIEDIYLVSRGATSKVEAINLKDILFNYRKAVNTLNLESLKLNSTTLVKESKVEIQGGFRAAYSDIIKEILSNYKTIALNNASEDIIANIPNKDVVSGVTETLFNYYNLVDTNNKEAVVIDTKRDVVIPSNEIFKCVAKYIIPVADVEEGTQKRVEDVDEVYTPKISFVEVTTEIDNTKYKSVRFGKRWRFKTGDAFDKVWINPEESQLTILANMRADLITYFIEVVKKQVLDDHSKAYSSSAKQHPIYTAKQIAQNTNLSGFMAQEIVTISSNFIDLYMLVYDNLDDMDSVVDAVSNVLESVRTSYYSKYITPYIEPKSLAVEARISFKAMLDFILFVEQLMLNNRFFYAASRAVTAIDDMKQLIDDWLSEQRPDEDLPDEYDYLRRWFNWWADGYKGKYINNMELNGLLILEKIRDEMVTYFERRWGKRVVEYGADNMLIYSKDYSYIDRIRGKKHGYAHRPVDTRRMTTEYGLSEFSLPYIVDQDS